MYLREGSRMQHHVSRNVSEQRMRIYFSDIFIQQKEKTTNKEADEVIIGEVKMMSSRKKEKKKTLIQRWRLKNKINKTVKIKKNDEIKK